MQFINAIITQIDDFEYRLHLRNELMRAGLIDVIGEFFFQSHYLVETFFLIRRNDVKQACQTRDPRAKCGPPYFYTTEKKIFKKIKIKVLLIMYETFKKSAVI